MKIFISHPFAERELAREMADAIRDEGHEVLLPSSLELGSNISAAISSAIRTADAVVAVVTVANPNIFYELGMAVGAGIPTVVAAPAVDVLPIELLSVPFVQVTGDRARDVREIAQRVTELPTPRPTILEARKSAREALSAAVDDPAALEAIAPSEFEGLLRQLFEELGYEVAARPSGPDWGVDFLIALDSETAVEVKKLNRNGRVSAQAVRSLAAAMDVIGVASGILISSAAFTAAAIAAAQTIPVTLLTLEELLAERQLPVNKSQE